MPSLTGFNVRFIPNWRMSILTLFALTLFMRLGFWQLERAHEKKQMIAMQTALASTKPLLWQPGDKFPVQYQQIKVQGHFLAKILLLDNQHHEHQFGYHVLSPLILSDNQVVLIDRGWVKGDSTRQVLPDIDTPNGFIHLTGSSYYPSDKNWLLGDLLEKKQVDLAVVELVDAKKIEQFLHKAVYPFIIRLDKNEAHGYVREWATVAMNPQRHYAYAFQWFAMALTIFILFIVLNLKKKT